MANFTDKQAKLLRQTELADLKAVLDTAHGRRFFWRILEHCGEQRTAYRGNTNDTMFTLGEQNVGLFLKAEAELARPGSYQDAARDTLRTRESLTNGAGHTAQVSSTAPENTEGDSDA